MSIISAEYHLHGLPCMNFFSYSIKTLGRQNTESMLQWYRKLWNILPRRGHLQQHTPTTSRGKDIKITRRMSANTIGQWFSFLESIKFNNKVKKKILYNYTSISHFCEVIKKSFGSHYDGNCDGNGSNLLEKHSQESRDANKHLQNSCDHHPALELQVRHNYLADTQFMQYCS